MDEKTPTFNKPDNSEQPDVIRQSDDNSPPPDPVVPKPRKRRKKLLMTILLIVFLLGGAAGAYGFYKFKNPPKSNNTVVQPPPQEPEHSLYFQVGSKIIRYAQTDKSISTLTASLPMGAEVLDFMADNSGWRAIYGTRSAGTEKPKIFIIEHDKVARAMAEDVEYITAAASAEHRIAAYTIPADTTQSSGPAVRTRTFLARGDGAAEEIFTSNPSNQKTASSDVKNYLYSVTETSANGEKLLFNLHSCYQCDGPPLAAAFEIDIKSKEAKLVYQSQEAGYVTYNPFKEGNQGYKVVESNGLGLGTDGPYELKVSQVDTLGGPAKQEFEASEPDWASLVFSSDRQYVLIDKKDKTFDETGKTIFDGLYTFGNSTVEKMTKQTVNNFPGEKFSAQGLGHMLGDCAGVSLYERAVNNPQDTQTRQQIGAICRGGAAFDYNHVDDLEYDIDQPYQYAKVLRPF